MVEFNRERFQNFSIELDCPPGQYRPEAVFNVVIKDTTLVHTDFSTGTPFFGQQQWILKEGSSEKDEIFTKNKPLFKQRITKLYKDGVIRHGSW